MAVERGNSIKENNISHEKRSMSIKNKIGKKLNEIKDPTTQYPIKTGSETRWFVNPF